jgi:type II secretory pathway component PulJ
MDIIAYVLLSAAIFYLAYNNFMQRQRQKRISSQHLQALFDLQLMKKELERAATEINNTKLEKDDGFVTFLSQSRDWAYEYIASTQETISKFNSDMEQTLESDLKPAQKLAKVKVILAELKKILPEEDKNIKEKQ